MGRRERKRKRNRPSEEPSPSPPAPPDETWGELSGEASEADQSQWLARFVHWYGPLPHPAILREFGKAVPGSDQEIVNQFREQGNHRRKMENRQSMSGIIGTTLSGLSVLAIVGTGLYLVVQGQYVLGASLLGSPILLAVVGHFFGKDGR